MDEKNYCVLVFINMCGATEYLLPIVFNSFHLPRLLWAFFLPRLCQSWTWVNNVDLIEAPSALQLLPRATQEKIIKAKRHQEGAKMKTWGMRDNWWGSSLRWLLWLVKKRNNQFSMDLSLYLMPFSIRDRNCYICLGSMAGNGGAGRVLFLRFIWEVCVRLDSSNR